MAKLDLSSYSLDKLIVLRGEIDSAIEKKKVENRTQILEKVKKMLTDNGMTMDDLTGRKRSKLGRPRKKLAPKYRNPKISAETWTGRGRKPRWVEAYLKAGGTMRDLEI